MLKKIKKYKINFRPSFILRTLKKKVNFDTNQTESVEKNINEEVSRLQKVIVSSSLYSSYSKLETPPLLKNFWQNQSNSTLALSIILTTIGKEIEKEIETAFKVSDMQGWVVDSIAREALEQSLNFTTKLIAEEAKNEDCELSPPLPIGSEEIKEVLPLLESEKAQIGLNFQGGITPFFTNASFCFWNLTSKKYARVT